MNGKTYMILLADRKMVKMFTILDGAIEDQEEFVTENVPQKVKHGANNWDSQDKIFRHIEDHVHRHLKKAGERAAKFAKRNNISTIIIGGHKSLFSKIEKHLPYPFSQKVTGRFVTELKAPFNEILTRAEQHIAQSERK